MRDFILDFITEYPIILICLPFLIGWTVYRYWQIPVFMFADMDAKSRTLLITGTIGAAVGIGIWLAYF